LEYKFYFIHKFLSINKGLGFKCSAGLNRKRLLKISKYLHYAFCADKIIIKIVIRYNNDYSEICSSKIRERGH